MPLFYLPPTNIVYGNTFAMGGKECCESRGKPSGGKPAEKTEADTTPAAGDKAGGGTTRKQVWEAFKRQMMLSLLSLLCTFVLMWVLRKSGKLDFSALEPGSAGEASAHAMQGEVFEGGAFEEL